jgi:integrase
MNPKSKYYGMRYVARWKLLKKLCKDAGVESFGYHDIRHTVAKYLNDLQQVMRHRKQSTNEIYVEGNYTDTQSVMKLLEEEKLKRFS